MISFDHITTGDSGESQLTIRIEGATRELPNNDPLETELARAQLYEETIERMRRLVDSWDRIKAANEQA